MLKVFFIATCTASRNTECYYSPSWFDSALWVTRRARSEMAQHSGLNSGLLFTNATALLVTL